MLKINGSVPIKILYGHPGTGVTVLLVFTLLHFSGGSVRYLVEPYHAEEFIQLKAFNWIVRTVCSLLQCGRNRIKSSVVEFNSVAATVQGSHVLSALQACLSKKRPKAHI